MNNTLLLGCQFYANREPKNSPIEENILPIKVNIPQPAKPPIINAIKPTIT